MRRWFRNWWTAHRLRLLLQYGWCPLCMSSPPKPNCYVCRGDADYGRHGQNRIWEHNYGPWASRYVAFRRQEEI